MGEGVIGRQGTWERGLLGRRSTRPPPSQRNWCGRGEDWRTGAGESLLPSFGLMEGLCFGMDLWAQEGPILALIKLESGSLTVKG